MFTDSFAAVLCRAIVPPMGYLTVSGIALEKLQQFKSNATWFSFPFHIPLLLQDCLSVSGIV